MNEPAVVRKQSLELGQRTITIETGQVARQANGSVVVRSGGAYLLGTVVAGSEASQGLGYVPLTVDYRELMSAAGRIPGSFQRREVRAAEHEVLVSRLIDRTLRPLFPKGFAFPLQVVVTVFSAERDSDLTTLAMLAACAALHSSDVPHGGPVAGMVTRDGGFELTVSATRAGIVMAEGHGSEVSNEAVAERLESAHADLLGVLDALDRLRAAAGNPKAPFDAPEADPALASAVADAAHSALEEALGVADKRAGRAARRAARDVAMAALAAVYAPSAIREAFRGLTARTLRDRALAGRRVGGRSATAIRALDMEVGLFAGSHGSARFARGETQALVSCTLGDKGSAQAVETLAGRHYDRFMLHYNFPSYSVGETGGGRGPGRRETGHGWLARRALSAVLPSQSAFPHTVRVLSEITDSNGSSSMATVCGASLALMDAGVPIRRPVAGIAMGLVVGPEGAAVLSDITGDEDHVGDMDFKICGTRSGVTAFQLDNKLGAVPRELLVRALAQASEGRAHILDEMDRVLDAPRDGASGNVPASVRLQIPRRHVGRLIGPGGRTIQDLQATSGARIKVDNSGQVDISGGDAAAIARAKSLVEGMFRDLVEGGLYVAEVQDVRNHGAMVRIGGHTALVHTSELSDDGRDASIVTSKGASLLVCALGVDAKGRLILSHRAAAGRDRKEALNAPQS